MVLIIVVASDVDAVFIITVFVVAGDVVVVVVVGVVVFVIWLFGAAVIAHCLL